MWLSLVKVLLILAFFTLVSICVFMRGKPVFALILWFQDFIKMDKSKFRGYGFWLFCGLGGSGKTLSMVEYLIRMRKKYPKLKIYTNFNFKLADGRVDSWRDIINLENYDLIEIDKNEFVDIDEYNRVEKNGKYYRKEHNGIIFGFDEIHLTFASQNWKDCPENMLEYISQQRKLHKQIIASSQVFTRVDKKLREQTNYVVECSSIFMGRLVFNRYFNTDEYLMGGEQKDSGKRRRKRAKRYSFVAYDNIREKYNTMEVMKNLSVGKSNSQQILDLIKSAVNN